MRTGKRILIIFVIALVCAAVIIGALFVSGIKLIREEAADGGEINFFGMTAGYIYYYSRDGSTYDVELCCRF